jgi:hypothetical protein
MTRKDYILLAKVFRDVKKAVSLQGNVVVDIDIVLQDIAEALQRDNPRFNREHFLAVVRGEKTLESRPTRTRWAWSWTATEKQ